MTEFAHVPLPDSHNMQPSLRKNLTSRLHDSIKSKLEIDKDIFLYMYKNKPDDEFFIVYELEVMRYCTGLHFVLDFEGSKNLSLIPFSDDDSGTSTGSGPVVLTCDENGEREQILQLHASVAPFQRMKFGQIHLNNPARRAVLKYKYSWKTCEVVSKEVMLRKSLQLEKSIERELQVAARLMPAPLSSNKFSSSLSPGALQQLFTNKHHRGLTSYIDPSFPPVESSLHSSSAAAIGIPPIETNFPVIWNRPRNFMNTSFQMYTDGIDPADIRQGYLADCWLLCAIASLAEFPYLIEALFPKSNAITGKLGCYEVRLCDAGQWVTVTVDDYFPCFPVDGGGPVFSQSHGNELWVLLLEKAFAKVRGSYASLRYGYSLEALIDLTGAPFHHFNLQQELNRDDELSLWGKVLEYDLKGYVMTGSTAGWDEASEAPLSGGDRGGDPVLNQGLVLGHAYTILEAKETSTGVRLLKLRNPWGMFEWTGDWSDDSPQWTSELLQELNYTLDVMDGTFWISFNDFLQFFIFFEVCMVRQHHLQNSWTEERCRLWISLVPPPLLTSDSELNFPLPLLGDIPRRVSSMFIYRVTGKSPTEVYFSLHQSNKLRSTRDGSPYIDIGVTVLRIEPNGTFTFACSSGLAVERQVQTSAFLEPGLYIVVPMTSGTKLKQYQLQRDSFSNHHPSNSREVKLFGTSKESFSDDVNAVYDEIFDRFDTDNDGLLTKTELDFFMTITNEGQAVDDNVYQWLVSNFESQRGGLTRQGFKDAQMYMFKASGCDEMTIWKDLLYMGYDRQLNLSDTENLTVVCHSESSDVSLQQISFDQDVFNEACDHLATSSECEVKELCEGELKMYIAEAGMNMTGVSLAIENCCPQTVEVELDCSNSTNTISSRGDLVFSASVCPGEVVLLHYLFPLNNAEDWSWEYSVSIIE